MLGDYQVYDIICFIQLECLSYYHKMHISEMQCNLFAFILCSSGNKMVF